MALRAAQKEMKIRVRRFMLFFKRLRIEAEMPWCMKPA